MNIYVKKDVLKAAIDRYGATMQSVVAMEECNELGQQIAKHIRGDGIHDNLVGEMADVLICMYELCEMYDVTEEELQETIDFKLSRLEKRMEADYEPE